MTGLLSHRGLVLQRGERSRCMLARQRERREEERRGKRRVEEDELARSLARSINAPESGHYVSQPTSGQQRPAVPVCPRMSPLAAMAGIAGAAGWENEGLSAAAAAAGGLASGGWRRVRVWGDWGSG